MSYTELHKGKLVPTVNYLSTNQFLEWLESNKEFHVDDLEEKIEDGYETLEVYDSTDTLVYLFTKNILYKVTDYSGGEYCSEELNQTIKQPDGSIDFIYLFYNGGTCFSEMLEEGLDSVKETEFNSHITLDDIPKGWVSIEEHLPMMLGMDILKGYTEYIVKTEEGLFTSRVSDHDSFYYYAKEVGITHWFNE